MAKEMVISSSPQETKIAVLEDGQVVEVYYEREKEYTLAGSIYKGRVTRILPGMQSAFVNIGLERDAFLYVSDFLEGLEEYDRVVTTPEERGGRGERGAPGGGSGGGPGGGSSGGPGGGEEPPSAEAAFAVPAGKPERTAAAEPAPVQASPANTGRPPRGEAAPGEGAPSEERPDSHEGSRRFSRRSRRGRGQRGFPESKYARRGPAQPVAPPPPRAEPAGPSAAPIILPGESLAKYKGRGAGHSGSPAGPLAGPSAPVSVPPSEAEAGGGAGTAFTGAAALLPMSEAAREEEQSRIEQLRKIEPMPDTTPIEEPAAAARHQAVAQEEERTAAPEESAAEDEFIEQLEAEDLEAEEAQEAEEAAEPDAQQLRSASAEAQGTPGPSFPASEEDNAAPAGSEQTGPAQSGGWEAEPTSETAAAEERIPAAEAPQHAEAAGSEAPTERQAVVRERGGNPRYLRKQRFARRGGRGEETRRRPGSVDREPPAKPMIGDMLKEGQEIIVQVAKEPLGKKGARITSHIALPGRYLVYMPTLEHVGVSRKIASDEERQRLKRIILTHSKNSSGGFIVRTAGVGRSEEDFRQDIAFLVKLWAEVKARSEKGSAPSLLHRDLDLVLRTLRDQLSEEFSIIWVDNEQAYEQIVSLVQKFQPGLVNRVRLYTKDGPLFEETGVQEEINRALKPKVWLKSGGYIVINQTEALVAIDVNTGKFVGKSNRLEDTIVKTNVEAIQEIVRQIRLRDLGGIIVIDFIDMDERKNRQKVMSALEESLRGDRAPSKILAFNEFGLVAITRKRVRQSLERSLCQPCTYCGGAGLVKSPATISLEILAEARKIASDLENKQVTLRVNPEVAKALKSRENTVLNSLEEIAGKGVIIRSDPAVHMENFYFD